MANHNGAQTGGDCPYEGLRIRRMVLAIGVHRNGPVRRSGRRPIPGEQGRPLATVGFMADQLYAGHGRQRPTAVVAGSVIHDNHRHLQFQRGGDDRSNGASMIVHRDDNDKT